jgi:hypothetical protein
MPREERREGRLELVAVGLVLVLVAQVPWLVIWFPPSPINSRLRCLGKAVPTRENFFIRLFLNTEQIILSQTGAKII